ncbi:MAG: GNAT family N-acetyltransferase [Actinomycetota bacterium]|nr:GNAT family N-acetyltransferase [Actinomycetota bacterium]
MSARVSIRAGRVLLRPFRDDEVEAMYEGLRGLPGNAHGPATSRAKCKKVIAASGRFARGRLDLAMEAEGRLIGDLQARSSSQLLPKGVVEIGVSIYAESDRSKGHGSEAVGAFTHWLLNEAGMSRVQAGTAISNVAMQRSFEKLGWKREGVMRAFWPSPDGTREDFVLYAVTRDG